MTFKQREAIRTASRALQLDRIFRDGVDWLAQNADNSEIGEGVRLLAYLVDTTDEWVWQAVSHRQDAIAANDRKAQDAALIGNK